MTRKKKDRIVRAYKHLLERDKDWDFCFLLYLERKKMKRMADYFSKSDITYSDPIIFRDLSLCIRLLDIILDEEKATIVWSRKAGEMMDMRFHKIPGEEFSTAEFVYKGMTPDFPIYVNTRNWTRFRSEVLSPCCSDDDSLEEKKWRSEHFKEDVRKAKAWHLYNLIREYRMFSWWD